jgi:hypothetical protein
MFGAHYYLVAYIRIGQTPAKVLFFQMLPLMWIRSMLDQVIILWYKYRTAQSSVGAGETSSDFHFTEPVVSRILWTQPATLFQQF